MKHLPKNLHNLKILKIYLDSNNIGSNSDNLKYFA